MKATYTMSPVGAPDGTGAVQLPFSLLLHVYFKNPAVFLSCRHFARTRRMPHNMMCTMDEIVILTYFFAIAWQVEYPRVPSALLLPNRHIAIFCVVLLVCGTLVSTILMRQCA